MADQKQSAVSLFHINLNLPTGSVALALLVLIATTIATAPAARAQTLQVLHSFTDGADGGVPGTSLVMDRAGNLYGTTNSDGTDGLGGVFKLVHGRSGWVLYTLYVFTGSEGNPPASLILGPDGNLYGANRAGGGAGSCGGEGCGTIFKLAPPATVCKSVQCPWTATILYHFTGKADGGNPIGLVFDSAGNLDGAGQGGGTSTNCGSAGCGVVFELSPSNGGWTETVLYSLQGGTSDGSTPYAGVIRDSEGNLYGTTTAGGTHNEGTAYELSPSGSGWTETILYNFGPHPQPYFPEAGLVRDSAGNLYGTTVDGGGADKGSVYSLSPSNGGWTQTLLYSFLGNYGDGFPGLSSLFMDAAGNLYGTTPGLESGGYGNVFKMTPSNGGWSYINLHSFTDGSDGAYPYSTPIMDGNGNLYGTTSYGGIVNDQFCGEGCGVVWEITP